MYCPGEEAYPTKRAKWCSPYLCVDCCIVSYELFQLCFWCGSEELLGTHHPSIEVRDLTPTGSSLSSLCPISPYSLLLSWSSAVGFVLVASLHGTAGSVQFSGCCTTPLYRMRQQRGWHGGSAVSMLVYLVVNQSLLIFLVGWSWAIIQIGRLGVTKCVKLPEIWIF